MMARVFSRGDHRGARPRRLAVGVVSAGLVTGLLASAPPAHAVPPNPVVGSVVAGEDIVHFSMASLGGAQDLSVEIFSGASCTGTRLYGPVTLPGTDMTEPDNGFQVINELLSTPRGSGGYGVVPGSPYSLKVTGVAAGESGAAPCVSFSMPAAPPAGTDPGTILSTNAFNRGAQIYTRVSDTAAITTYAVLYSTAPSQGRPEVWLWVPGEVPAFDPLTIDPSIANLTNGTGYQWKIITLNGYGFGSWASAGVTPAEALPPPYTWPNARGAWGGIDLSWPSVGPTAGLQVTGYRIDYTTDEGLSWTTLVPDTGTTVTQYTALGLDGGHDYRFRVAALAGGVQGGWSQASDLVNPFVEVQTVSWAPTNTNVLTTDSPLTPSEPATTSGDGAISYAVTSAGTTRCTVNAATGVLTFTAPGSCEVTATASGTPIYASGSKAVTFVIREPGQSSPGGGGDAVAGVPDNPGTATSPIPGLIVVSSADAQAAIARPIKVKASKVLKKARTVRVKKGQLISLLVSRLPKTRQLVARVTIRKRTALIGRAASNPKGVALLPVFQLTRKGLALLTITKRGSRTPYYVKIRVS